MSHSIEESVFTSLIKQLVYLDENSTLLLDQYAPRHDRERKEIEKLLTTYRQKLEVIVGKFNSALLQTIVLIGSQVTVNNDGYEEAYTIVLPEHSDMDQYYISFLSPIGRNLLLAQVGETITVQSPAGHYDLRITNVDFSN